jgi:hypothetical protein
LPPGAFHFDVGTDPEENRPGPIPERLVTEIGTAFAATAGRMVPGLQVLVWGNGGPAVVALDVKGELEVVQAWSTGTLDVVRSSGRLELHCDEAAPLCAVAVSTASVPAAVTPLDVGAPWPRLVEGLAVDPRSLVPPTRLDPGAHLWWNPDRPIVVGGYDETLDRLRALGYID